MDTAVRVLTGVTEEPSEVRAEATRRFLAARARGPSRPPRHPRQAKIDALEARALDPGATEEERRTAAVAAVRLRRGEK